MQTRAWKKRKELEMKVKIILTQIAVIAIFFSCLITPRIASAHCDALDGPVVTTARKALEKGDVTSILKWVKEEHEDEIRTAFSKTLTVRSKGPEAKELADMYFLETLVRLHRAGEGAPYDGLKPAGMDLGPAIEGADKALENGSVEHLVELMLDVINDGIRKRFVHAVETKKDADASVDAGRKFVEAYVEFVHYVKRLHQDAVTNAAQHGETEGEPSEAKHHH